MPRRSPRCSRRRSSQTLETLVEAIIPTDERSPGAKEARVADYIDLLLSEADRELALQWFGGLAALDAEATARFRAPFVRLDAPPGGRHPRRPSAATSARRRRRSKRSS